MMESGTTSAQHGRIPPDHGSCIKMARLELLEKAFKKVNFLAYLPYPVHSTEDQLKNVETLRAVIYSEPVFIYVLR